MPKQITLDELAIMINKGFMEQDKSLSEFKRDVESRFKEQGESLSGFKKEMYEFRDDTMVRFDRIEKKLDSLEDVVFNDHGRRLRKIENKLAIA